MPREPCLDTCANSRTRQSLLFGYVPVAAPKASSADPCTCDDRLAVHPVSSVVEARVRAVLSVGLGDRSLSPALCACDRMRLDARLVVLPTVVVPVLRLVSTLELALPLVGVLPLTLGRPALNAPSVGHGGAAVGAGACSLSHVGLLPSDRPLPRERWPARRGSIVSTGTDNRGVVYHVRLPTLALLPVYTPVALRCRSWQ